MGYFRFRKTFSIFPGVRINLSKTGVSSSLGGHGATVNVGKNGPMVTLGVPGTGLSYRTPLGWALFGGWNVRLKPEITPELMELRNPKGLPTTKASSPTCMAPGFPKIAGTNCGGMVCACSTAISLSGCAEITIASDWVPSAKVTCIFVASATTCRLVKISPASSMITPVPKPLSVSPFTPPVSDWIQTSDGWIT